MNANYTTILGIPPASVAGDSLYSRHSIPPMRTRTIGVGLQRNLDLEDEILDPVRVTGPIMKLCDFQTFLASLMVLSRN
ncbi:MAG: hypothetical protein QXL70_00045 [Metallosphaera sp.]